MEKFKGSLALILTGLIYSFTPLLIRLLSGNLSNLMQVFLRSIFICLILANIIIIKGERSFIRKDNFLTILIFCLGFPSSTILFTISVNTIRASDTVFLLY